MPVFSFTHALARTPGRSVVDGLRDDPRAVPDYGEILKEHAAYVAALRAVGVAVDVLDPLEAFPDSVFVEDPALVFGDGAILLRPGAPSRLGERDAMRGELARRFGRVLELGDGEYADGGDVLVTPNAVFIGLSQRTNEAGAAALVAHLRTLGRIGRVVETPPGILHFKTAVSLLAEDTLLATPAMAASGLFAGFEIVQTPPGEDATANALRVNDTVFASAQLPRTIDALAKAGYGVTPLSVREIAKLDGGLSCMSLRWHTGA
ncbi:MAG TPA: arginine deiminase family protein [Rhizomicrobium sp.]|jgi:dimethylargininase|nr:arginine deiminase family protein [Rhizomicrobium sp.]